MTILSCRRRTRATRCLTPIVLYTKVGAHCDKLVTDERRQFITPKLTTLATVDVQLRNFQSPEFGTQFVIFGDTPISL